MEVISVILMFVFGNMNDQATQMTQYIPMKSLSSCMNEVIALYNEIPAGATMVKKDIDAAAFERWSLRAKAKWD